MRFSVLARPAAALLALAALLSPARAEELYLRDVLAKTPALLKSWRAVVPKAYAGEAWLRRLQGVETPVETREIGGKTYYLGWLCKPHDCGDNQAAVLLPARGGAKAYGALISPRVKQGGRAYFGDPSEEAKAALDKLLQKP